MFDETLEGNVDCEKLKVPFWAGARMRRLPRGPYTRCIDSETERVPLSKPDAEAPVR